MISGVPQGLVLGPLLFIAYVDDIDDQILTSSVLIYTDDMKIYVDLKKNNPDLTTAILQSELDSLSESVRMWQLRFNVDKCVVMHFGRGNPQTKYSINGQQLHSSDLERDLGVLLSNNLKFTIMWQKWLKKPKVFFTVFVLIFLAVTRKFMSVCISNWSDRSMNMLQWSGAPTNNVTFN